MSGAEPQRCEPKFKQPIERKADTMKSYILRPAQTVQSQMSTVPVGAKAPVLFIGLDVHNDSIAVSLAPSDATEVRRYGIIGGEHADVLKLVKRLQAGQPGTTLKLYYEAGPRGFVLCRCLRAHGIMVGYNAQVAVDAKHKLIAADDVTNEGTDFKQLANVALEAKANLEFKQAEAVADAGYYNAAEVSRCAEQGITAYVPKADTSANTARGLYGKSRFRYDEKKDVYVCPAGAELTYRFNTYELGRELRYYRASGCKGCALKKQCTRNKANRTITREENEALMEAMAARMKAQPEKFKLRKELAEHPFGTTRLGVASGEAGSSAGLGTRTFCSRGW
jgi:transposase